MLVQIVVQFLLYEVSDEFIHGQRGVGSHFLRSEFSLGLTLEHRLLDADAHRGHSVADVGEFVALAAEFLYGAAHMLAESREMRAPLSGMLSVHETVVFLTVLVGVRQHHLDVVALKMYDGVEGLRCHVFLKKIQQTVTALILLAVEHDEQTYVKVSVVVHHHFDGFRVEPVSPEQIVVRGELHECAVRLVRRDGFRLRFEIAAVENHGDFLSVTD